MTSWIFLILAVFALSACGGGDGGGGPIQETPNPSPGTIGAPSGLSVTISDTQIEVKWNAVSGAKSYTVKRGTTRGSHEVLREQITTTSFVDTNVQAGTTYYYVVVATDGTRTSEASAEIAATPALQAARVTQYGITWVFDQDYPVGQYANGDWWVVGPVRLLSITPEVADGRNGWAINPRNYAVQPYDRFAPHYSTAELPSLPLTVPAGSSIVKTISRTDADVKCRPCLKTAAVLTVVDAVPAGGGAGLFRPPYVGTEKAVYSVESLRLDLLPSLAPPAGTIPTLASIERRFARVQLDSLQGYQARNIHPVDNMPNYGADIATDTGDSALRLMLNDPIADKRAALIAYIQQGIDYYHMLKTGLNWAPNGGHMNGRKLPIAFAGIMLDDAAMQAAVRDAPEGTFSEDAQIYFSQKADGGRGMVLWGRPCTEAQYWDRISTQSGPRECRDPYGLIDGGSDEVGEAYQVCCTTQIWKAPALATLIMPQLAPVWNNPNHVAYITRWVNHGVWTQPDNCALQRPASFTGNCVPGTGRFSTRHGNVRDGGDRRSAFASAMWDRYRN